MRHFVPAFVLFVLVPRLALAAAVPPAADFPVGTTGFVNGCKYKV